eukprot:tig00000241_g20999.t1
MDPVDPVIAGLKKTYAEKIKPLETAYRYGDFYSQTLTDADIEAKPLVLLIGQYSTGKTTFVKHLLGRDFPGAHIGPEPTTDRFMAIMHGNEERRTPGAALSVQTDRPFRGLQKFGTSFLQRMESSELPAPLLKSITLIDSPGVLAGEKQRLDRGYDFCQVIEWFAEKADLILLLFDAYKLDISDEFKRAIEALKGNDDKIRVVLNKADQVSTQQLMRVYGAMMWALGKVVRTPEVMRVYMGSFWEQPCRNPELAELFRREHADLMRDLQSLPKMAAVRKTNEMVKRARLARLHAYIIHYLRKQMPALFGKKSAQAEMLAHLDQHFMKIHVATQIPPGDFPHIDRFKEKLALFDLKKQFPKLDKKLMELLDSSLNVDLPNLCRRFTGLEADAFSSLHTPLPPLPGLDNEPDSPRSEGPSAPVSAQPSFSAPQMMAQFQQMQMMMQQMQQMQAMQAMQGAPPQAAPAPQQAAAVPASFFPMAPAAPSTSPAPPNGGAYPAPSGWQAQWGQQ